MDGRRVTNSLLSRAIYENGAVWQWQIVQQARDRLLVRFRVAPHCHREGLTAAVVAAARERMGEGMAVEVRFEDEIASTAAGKQRHVINEVRPTP
jgi:hypothetical protein